MPTTSTFSSAATKLIVFWFVLLLFAAWSKFGPLALLALSLTGAMPFALFVLWLGLSDTGKKIRDWFGVWHLRVFSGALLFCYVTYGRKWAGDIINEVFNLDARFFGITSAVLTVLFTPFGLLYRAEVIGEAFDLFTITAGFVIPGYFFYLLLADGIQGRAKKIGYLFFAVMAGAAVFAFAFNIAKSFKPAVKAFAVWADFNDNHLCTDSWVTEAKGVVFLDNGKVLGFFPQASDYRFKVVACDYAKKDLTTHSTEPARKTARADEFKRYVAGTPQ